MGANCIRTIFYIEDGCKLYTYAMNAPNPPNMHVKGLARKCQYIGIDRCSELYSRTESLGVLELERINTMIRKIYFYFSILYLQNNQK